MKYYIPSKVLTAITVEPPIKTKASSSLVFDSVAALAPSTSLIAVEQDSNNENIAYNGKSQVSVTKSCTG